MNRFVSGIFFAIVLGIGAGIGTAIASLDPNTIVKAVIGATICGFFLGMAKGNISNDKK